jgi:creatinine amidohydrolase
MRIRDLNWMQLEEYLRRDDRIVLPVGSTEQHAYLSLETDNIVAERLAVEAAEPLGVPVLPVLAYGITDFDHPGSPSLRPATFAAVLRDILDSLHTQGFRRFLVANGHGGKPPLRRARVRRRRGAMARRVERAAGRGGGRDRPRLRPRVMVGELSLDAPSRSRDAD